MRYIIFLSCLIFAIIGIAVEQSPVDLSIHHAYKAPATRTHIKANRPLTAPQFTQKNLADSNRIV